MAPFALSGQGNCPISCKGQLNLREIDEKGLISEVVI